MADPIVLTIGDYREQLEHQRADVRYADEMMNLTPCHAVDYQQYEDLKAQARKNIAKLEDQIANMQESELNWQWLWDKCVEAVHRVDEWQIQYDIAQTQ